MPGRVLAGCLRVPDSGGIVMHTPREDLERLAEQRREPYWWDDLQPSSKLDEGSAVDLQPSVNLTEGKAADREGSRDRSRLPKVFLDARRRLRERLEQTSAP
jgi:hypothetical protein